MSVNDSLDFEVQVQTALGNLRHAMTADGGGAQLVECDADRVVVELTGSCCCCPSAKLSAAALQRGLRDQVPSLQGRQIIIRRAGDGMTLAVA